MYFLLGIYYVPNVKDHISKAGNDIFNDGIRLVNFFTGRKKSTSGRIWPQNKGFFNKMFFLAVVSLQTRYTQ